MGGRRCCLSRSRLGNVSAASELSVRARAGGSFPVRSRPGLICNVSLASDEPWPLPSLGPGSCELCTYRPDDGRDGKCAPA